MLNIGKELKELRLQKGLTLKEISEITKINIKYLELIEENNFHFLPEVYVRGFLKNYVRAIEGDEKKFLEAFEEIRSPVLNEPQEKQEEEPQPISEDKEVQPEPEIIPFSVKKFLIGKSNIITIRNVSFLVGAIIILVFVIILILTQKSKKEENLVQTAAESMYEEVQEKSEKFDNIALDDSLILGINAKDSVWIQVKLDDSVIQEVYLRNGQSQKFKAMNNFQLLVGNAGAIALYLNETELPFVGVKGSVKRLKIDKNGIKLIQAKNEPQKQ